MRTVAIKDTRDWESVKKLSQETNYVNRKFGGFGIVEVINIGKYGYVNRIFTTEKTLAECKVKYKEV